MAEPSKPLFIFTTSGDWSATLLDVRLYDTRGEYIGFIEGAAEKLVYTREGEWVGMLTKDGRITRKRGAQRRPLHAAPLAKLPQKPALPGRSPLPPQMSELSYDTVDMLEEDPDVFKRLSDRRKDLGE
jgi:hypothetical protein